MATFDEVEKYVAQRAALDRAMLELRTQLAMVRNAAAENATWLRANSSLVRGWKLRAKEKSGAVK